MSLINRIAMVIMVAGSFSVGCCDAKAEPESVASPYWRFMMIRTGRETIKGFILTTVNVRLMS